KAFGALLKCPSVPGLTESLTDLSPTEWRTILARLRRARLLAAKDPHNPRHLDTHPLVREYFGKQLRSQRTEAWRECNRRLCDYYRALVPQLPDSFREIPYWLALKAEALHLADRTSEALEAINEAEAIIERREERWWCAELHRLRGVFLANIGADETQIEA